MNLDEFFTKLESLPCRWILTGSRKACIRTAEDGFTPLEAVCYAHGGTVSWNGGRIQKPSLLNYHWQQANVLGLPEVDGHAIFRASDNNIVSGEQGFNQKDYEVRQKLLKACKK